MPAGTGHRVSEERCPRDEGSAGRRWGRLALSSLPAPDSPGALRQITWCLCLSGLELPSLPKGLKESAGRAGERGDSFPITRDSI